MTRTLQRRDRAAAFGVSRGGDRRHRLPARPSGGEPLVQPGGAVPGTGFRQAGTDGVGSRDSHRRGVERHGKGDASTCFGSTRSFSGFPLNFTMKCKWYLGEVTLYFGSNINPQFELVPWPGAELRSCGTIQMEFPASG